MSNYRFKSILSWSTKSEFVWNEYFLPKKLSVRHENISGSHKTVFLIIKTLFSIVKTSIPFPWIKEASAGNIMNLRWLRPKFYNAWQIESKSLIEIDCTWISECVNSNIKFYLSKRHDYSDRISCSFKKEKIIVTHSHKKPTKKVK